MKKLLVLVSLLTFGCGARDYDDEDQRKNRCDDTECCAHNCEKTKHCNCCNPAKNNSSATTATCTINNSQPAAQPTTQPQPPADNDNPRPADGRDGRDGAPGARRPGRQRGGGQRFAVPRHGQSIRKTRGNVRWQLFRPASALC